MGARLFKIGVMALEVAGLLLAVAAALLLAVAWNAETEPVKLDAVAPLLEQAIVKSSAAFTACEIESITLRKADARAPQAGRGPDADSAYILTIRGLQLYGEGGRALARLPRAVFAFAAKDFLSARFGPQTIKIDDAALRIVRRDDRRLNLDYGAPSSRPSYVFQNLTGGAYFREAFERAVLNDAYVEFFDQATGRSWTAPAADMSIERAGATYAARLRGDLLMDSRDAALDLAADYDADAGRIDARLGLEAAPLGDLLRIFFGLREDYLTAPVTGRGDISLTADGRVLSSHIEGAAGKGTLSLGGTQIGVDRLAAAIDFDAGRNEFVISDLSFDTDRGAGAITGLVTLENEPGRLAPTAAAFELASASARLDLGAAFEAPIDIEDFAASGRFETEAADLDLTSLRVRLNGARVDGTLRYAPRRSTQTGPRVRADLSILDPLSKADLIALWPRPAAAAARDFVVNRILDGRFSDVKARVDYPGSAQPGDVGMADDALSLTFKADGARVVYAPALTPIDGLVGEGRLGGNSFHFTAERGRVGDVELLEGGVAIEPLTPKGAPAIFTFKIRGGAEAILTELNKPPLAVMANTPFTPAQFAGAGVVDAKIIRPNQRDAPPESYRFEADARFPDLSVAEFFGDIPLTDADTTVTLQTDRMSVAADALLGSTPVAVNWAQAFYGEGERTVIQLDGVIDSAAGDLLGAPTRQFIRGAAPFALTARGDLNGFDVVDISADFTEAALAVGPIGFVKPPAERAVGRLSITTGGDDPQTNDAGGARTVELALEGDRIDVVGAASLGPDGALARAVIERFSLDGAADVSARVRRVAAAPGAPLRIDLTGAHLNLGPALEAMMSGEGGDGDVSALLAGIEAAARIERLDLRAGVSLRDAALDFHHGAERLEALEFIAISDRGGPLSLALDDVSGGPRNLVARADDVGALLAGFFGLGSIEGGRGVVSLDYSAADEATGPSGVIEAQDLSLVGAPLLARIFAAGSLTGLVDLLNGDGIKISNASADFAFEDGEIRLDDARASGPSVGLTAQGAFQLNEPSRIALSGAVAPAYQINSFLGRAPLIGDLFVNRSGEGVLALAYEVAGDADNPRIFVKPLSALAPGVLRRMFEPTENNVTDGETDDEAATTLDN